MRTSTHAVALLGDVVASRRHPDPERRRAFAEPLRTAGISVVETGDAEVASQSLGVPGFDAVTVRRPGDLAGVG